MKIFLVLLALLFIPAPLFADPTRALRDHVLSPKQVLRVQNELDLSKKQKKALRFAIKEAKKEIVDLEFELENEVEKLVALVKTDKVDEQQASAQAAKVLDIESKIKIAQLKLSLKTKNLLTKAQRDKVAAFMNKKKAEREKARKKRQQQRNRPDR